ncbi:MAG: Ig-like domain-containing protein [Candidatus Desantisbacteria bacterium]
MRKIWVFLILMVLLNLALPEMVMAGEGGYDCKGSWAGESPENDKYFSSPKGVAVDANGNIFVADTNNHRIQKFDSSGKPLLRWGSLGTMSGQFDSPADVAVDGSGYVYVLDTGNNRVQKFSENGVFVTYWGSEGNGNGQFRSPQGIAVGTDSYVYVIDTNNNRVQRFNNSGGFDRAWGDSSGPLVQGKFLSPQGIAVFAGSVYVADTYHNAIQRFTTTGTFTSMWGTTTLSGPDGIVVDSSGNIYVANNNHRIVKFDSTGSFTLTWGSEGTSTGYFTSPTGIAIDPSGNIYVADTDNHRIQAFTNTGNFTSTFGQMGNSNGILNSPLASAIAPDGSIYIADTNNHQIQRFSATGTFISKWGSFGSATGLFNTPRGITVDPIGNVYVVDSGNNRIQKFTANGTFTLLWTNSLKSPHNIAAAVIGSQTYVFVVNTNEHRVEQFNTAGVFVRQFGSYGAANGLFYWPKGIAIDVTGNIYVADTNNHRIQKFTCDGNYITQWGNEGTLTGQFKFPTAVSIDHYGYIYVVDSNNHRIQKFSSSGSFITAWGSQGTGTGTGVFNLPQGIVIGTTTMGHERVYVVDTNNHRIQYFEPTPLAVTTIAPVFGLNTGTIACTITGAGFFSQVRAELYRGSSTIAGTTTSVPNSGTFTCTFDLTNTTWGSYSLRVLNPNGTTSIVTKTDAFYIIDPIAPTIAIATTMDTDNDGWIDAIGITFSESIKDSSVILSDFSITGIGTPTGSSTGQRVDDNYIELTFADGSLTTSATPTLTYTAGSLTDLYGAAHGGNLLASITTTIQDSARPVLKLVTPSSNGVDNNSISVKYWLSEPCASGTVRLMFQGATSTIYILGTNAGTTTTTVTGIGLIDGTYAVTLIATDLAGNAGTSNISQNWQYDNTLPVLTLIKPAAGASDNEQISVEYNLSEEVAILTLTFDGTISTTLSAKTIGTHSQVLDGKTLLGSSTGTYTVTLNATDLAGNTSSVTNSNWIYDTSPPVITLVSPKTDGCGSLWVGVEYYLSKEVGSHSIWLMFYSSKDPKSPRKANTIFSGTKGTHTTKISGVDLLSDGSTTSDDSLIDGCVYDVIMTAVDGAGNPGTSGTNTGWTYDITLPSVTMSKPSQDGFDNQTISVEYNLSEQASTVTMLFIIGTSTVHATATMLSGKKGDNSLTLGTSSISSALSDGTFTVKLMAWDMAGNEAVTAISSNWTYDIMINTPVLKLASESTYATSRAIDVLVENNTDVVKWLINEEAITRPDETDVRWTDSKPTSFNLSSGDGKKTVYIWIKDGAGNVNSTRVSKDIILDQNLPTIVLSQPAANTSNNGSLTITYWLSEELAANTIKLVFGTKSVTSTAFIGDKGTNTVKLDISAIGLTDGATYTLTITGNDLPGNQGTSNNQTNWRYDVTPPVITLIKPTGGMADNQSIGVEYALSEDVNPSSLKIAFTRDTWTATATNIGTATKGTWAANISGIPLGLTDGTYAVTLSATDMAGNLATPTVVSNWTYDTNIGSITLSIPAGSYTNQAGIAVSIGTITPQETVSYLLSEEYTSGTWTTTKPATYTLSAGDGIKTLYLWVKDSAGNITPTPATTSITLDTTRPIITLNKPIINGFGNGSIALSYTLNEDVKPANLLLTFAGTTLSTTTLLSGTSGTHEMVLNIASVLGANEGTYTVCLSAEDMAGNTNTSNIADTWTYDITQPKGTLSMPAPNGIDDQNISVRYTLSEEASSVRLIFTQVGGTPDEFSPHAVTARLATSTGSSGTITLNGSDLNNDQNVTTNDILKSNAVYNVYIEIIDKAGNRGSSSINGTWTYDSQAPGIKLIEPSTNGFDNNSIAVNYTLDESVSPLTIKLIFEGPATITVPAGSLTVTRGDNSFILYGTSGLKEGTYSVRMEAEDLAGNKGGSNLSTNWVYDNTIGTTTVKLAKGATYTKTALVEMEITEDADVINWHYSETQKTQPNEGWKSEPSAFPLSSGDGTKTVYVWVKDRAGNINGTTATIVLDTNSPVVTLNKPAPNSMDNEEILVNYAINERVGIASVTLSFIWTGGTNDSTQHEITIGLPTMTTTFTIDGENLPGGAGALKSGAIYKVSLQAVDLAGNVSIINSNSNWTYDIVDPTISINKPETNGVDNQSLTVKYTLSEAIDPSTVRLIFISGTTTHTITSRFFTGNIDNNTVILDGTALSEGTSTVWSLTHGATYTVKMSCADWAGNIGSSNPVTNLVDNWTYDNQIAAPTCFKIYDQNSKDTIVTVSAVVKVDIEAATETVGWLLSEIQTTPPAESAPEWLATKPTAFQLSVGNGTKTVYLWCKDSAGNISSTVTATIKLDTTKDVTPPTISLILPATNGVDNGSITVSYTLSEPCKSDNVIFMFGTHTGTVTNLTGNYGANTVVVDGSIFELVNGQTYGTITLSMVDFAGNRGTSTPVITNWKYDTDIPSIQGFCLKDRLSKSVIYTNSASVDVVVGTYSSDVIKWIISEEHSNAPAEDSGLWNSPPSVYSLNSGDGTKTVYLWCKDRAGNIGGATATITMDLTKPTITLNSPSTGGISNGSITLNYTLSENIGSGTLVLTFTRTGGAMDTAHTRTIGSITVGSHEMMLSGVEMNLRDGAVYAVSLEGYDLAGNCGQASNTNWRYDISIATPTLTMNNGAGYTKTRQVNVNANNDAEAVGWLIGTMTGKPAENDPGWLAEEPTVFDLGVLEGTRSVYLWTRDAVGNISATATASIVLDTLPATVTLTMLAVDNQSIAATYSFSENVATATISFASSGQVVGTRLVTLVSGTHTVEINGLGLGLIDGSYTVSIEAVDFAGNYSKVSNTNWRYDATPPTIALDKPAIDGVDNQIISVAYTASEALSSMMLVFSSGGTQVYTATCSVGTTTIDGSGLICNATYTVQIIGTDTAGNVGSSNIVSNWRYDNEVATPTLRLFDQTTGSETMTVSAVVRIGIDAATDTVGWWLSEQSATPDENSTQWVSVKPDVFQLSLGTGTKIVYLWIKDKAGNVSQPGTASILLDTTQDKTLPAVNLITPSTNGADNASIKVSYWLSEPCQGAMLTFGTITVTGSLTGQYGTNTVTLDGSSLGLGNGQTYTVSLIANDMNNNRATATNTNWTYDTEIAIPSFYMMNKITGSRMYTHTPRVDVSVSQHLEAIGWLMSESSGTPSEEAVINAKPYEFTLSSGDNTKTVYLWAKDRAGNVSLPATARIILNSNMDVTPPVVNLISPAINGVDNESISVNYTISEDVSALVFTFTRTGGTADDSHSYGFGTTCLLAGQHELVVNLGLQHNAIYSVSLKAVDAYGNSGQGVNANWRYDISIATPTLTLNNGAGYTKTRQVSVSVNNDAEAVGWFIGTATGKPAENDLRWLTEEPSAFELGVIEGVRNVCLWTKDAVGNVSGTATDSIVLDTVPATVTLTMPNNPDNQSVAVGYQFSESVATASLTFSSQQDANSSHQVLVAGTSGSLILNGADLNSDGQKTTYDYLKDGATYTVTLEALDLAGNISIATTSWKYDNSISTPKLTLFGAYTATRTIMVSISNDIDTNGWLVSETQTTQPSEGWQLEKPATITLSSGDGHKSIFVWVKDAVGNICPSPAQGTITLDTIKPQINLIKPEAGTTDNQLVVKYHLSEDVATETLHLVFFVTSSVYTVTTGLSTNAGTHSIIPALTLPDGTYSVTLSASDMAGNIGTPSTHANWRYDTSVGTAILILRDQTTTSSTYTMTSMVRVEISTDVAVEWLLSESQTSQPKADNSGWQNTKPTIFALSNGDGTKTVCLWVKDENGNISQKPATATIMLSTYFDRQPPVITLNSPSTNGISNGSITLNYTLSENIGSGTLMLTFIRISGAMDTPHTCTVGDISVGIHDIQLSGMDLKLKDGAVYAVSLEGSDLAGNQGRASNTNWRYDTTIATPILILNQGTGYAKTQQITVSINNDAEAVGWLIGTTTGKPDENDSRWQNWRPVTFGLDGIEGTKSVSLWIRDGAGNISATATASIVYDITIATPFLSMTDRNTASGTFTASLLVSVNIGTDTDAIGWLLSESQTTPPAENDPHWLASLPSVFSLSSGSGEKSVYLWIKDMAGNMSWVMDSIAIDTESPIIILSQPAAGGFGTQGVRVLYSLSEDIASGTLRLSFIRTSGVQDGYSPHQIVLGSSSYSFVIDGKENNLVDGAIYTVTLEGQDAAGNKAQLATSANWTYDLSAPIITLHKPSSNGCDNHDLELSYVLSEDVKPDSVVLQFGGTATTAALPYAKGTNTTQINIAELGLIHGQTYTVTMHAVDMAGNLSATVTKTNWSYDDYIGTPTLELATSTASRLIYGTITNNNDTVAWLLGEDKNAQPSGNDPGWRSTRPTAIYLSSAGAGDKQVGLWVRDASGNTNGITATITLATETTSAPLGVSIQSPQSGDVGSQTIRLQYTLTEPVDPESLKFVFTHTAGVNDQNSPHTVTYGLESSAGVHVVWINGYDLNLVDGAVYTLRLEAMADTLETAQVNNLRYDISPPVMSLISPATNGYGKEIITVRYQASEPLAENSLQLVFYRGQGARTVTTLLLSQQGGMYIKGNDLNNDGTQSTNDTLTNGATYTVCLMASDLAGNKAAPVFITNWIYDTTIGTPSLSLAEGATYTNSSIVTVETTGDTDVAKWLISETQKTAPMMDNPMWTNKPTAYSFSIGEGKKTVYLWVCDGAGNINTTPAVDTIIMDIISPQITLNSPATNGAGNGTITVSYYLSEAVAAGTLTFNPTGGGTDTLYVVTELLLYCGENMMEITVGLKNGTTYAVSLDATDFAGNIGITAVNHNWKYDTTIGMPTMLLRDHLTNGTQCTGARLVRAEISGDDEAVKWLISEDAHAMDDKDLPWQQDKPAYFTLGTTSGVRTVYLWIQDRAGNISSVAQDSISLDMEIPQSSGTPTTNGQFFPGGNYTLNWDAFLATSGIERYEVQEFVGSTTLDVTDWDGAVTYRVATNSMDFKDKKHGDSLWYRVRARNNVGMWSSYSAVSKMLIIAPLFGTTTEVCGSSTDNMATINIPQGVLTTEIYIIIERDPLNYGKYINPKTIKAANAKDDVDLSFDRLEDTMTEFNAYTYNNGTPSRIGTFTRKVRISLRYRDVNQDGFVDNVPYKLDELTLKVYRLNETTQQWVAEESSKVDPVANIVSVDVDHFSTFILQGIPLRPAAVLGNVRVYPNPYKPNSNPMHNSGIHFGGTAAPFEERLTEQVTIKIFTVSGELVRVINGQTSGEYVWDAKNDEGDEVATGVYIYQITNEQAGNSFGKIAIVR